MSAVVAGCKQVVHFGSVLYFARGTTHATHVFKAGWGRPQHFAYHVTSFDAVSCSQIPIWPALLSHQLRDAVHHIKPRSVCCLSTLSKSAPCTMVRRDEDLELASATSCSFFFPSSFFISFLSSTNHTGWFICMLVCLSAPQHHAHLALESTV